jgi:hypothetical protein
MTVYIYIYIYTHICIGFQTDLAGVIDDWGNPNPNPPNPNPNSPNPNPNPINRPTDRFGRCD